MLRYMCALEGQSRAEEEAALQHGQARQTHGPTQTRHVLVRSRRVCVLVPLSSQVTS